MCVNHRMCRTFYNCKKQSQIEPLATAWTNKIYPSYRTTDSSLPTIPSTKCLIPGHLKWKFLVQQFSTIEFQWRSASCCCCCCFSFRLFICCEELCQSSLLKLS